jgi:hypothetical protein
MRNCMTYAALCLGVVMFFVLIAAEDYSWTSSRAYVQVRTAELLVIAVLYACLCLVVGICALTSWCHWKLVQLRRWWQARKMR